jgi:hypothetical protein
MNSSTKAVAALAGGYLLGRSKKMRLAVTVAGLVAGKKLDLSTGELLQKGAELIQGSPELSRLSAQLRGRFLEAAKGAAVAAASNRLNSVSDSLRDRSSGPRGLAGPEVEAEDEAEDDSWTEDEDNRQNGSSEDAGRGRRTPHPDEDERPSGAAPRRPARKASASGSGSKAGQAKKATPAKQGSARKSATGSGPKGASGGRKATSRSGPSTRTGR